MQSDNTITITSSAMDVITVAKDRIVFPDATRDYPFVTLTDDHHEAVTFIQSLTTLLKMGGHVYAESPTMLILTSTSGMTVGMHYDGKEWSTHS